MKKNGLSKKTDKLFVLIVFALSLTLLLHKNAITGNTILQDGNKIKETILAEPGFFFKDASNNQGDILKFKQNGADYFITTLRVYQEYSSGTEFIEIMLLPSNVKIKLYEGEDASLDFNNDGVPDARLNLRSISYGQASITIVSP